MSNDENTRLIAENAALRERITELERDVRNVTDWAMTREAERDGLQTRIDKALALADEWEREATRYQTYVAGSSIPEVHKSVAHTLSLDASQLRAALSEGEA